MGVVLSVVKLIGPPGSIPLLVLSLFAGWLLLRRGPRWRRLAQGWIAAVLVGYLVLAVPVTAHGIASHLPPVAGTDPSTLTTLDTIVVFDGDNRWGRARMAAQMAAASPNARLIVLGEKWLVRRLTALGIAESRFTRDEDPPTTQAQMDWLVTHAGTLGPRTAIIVSRLQLPRVIAIAGARGQTVTAVASPVDVEPPDHGFRAVVPSYASLQLSRDAIYELAALAYYDWRGYGPRTH